MERQDQARIKTPLAAIAAPPDRITASLPPLRSCSARRPPSPRQRRDGVTHAYRPPSSAFVCYRQRLEGEHTFVHIMTRSARADGRHRFIPIPALPRSSMLSGRVMRVGWVPAWRPCALCVTACAESGVITATGLLLNTVRWISSETRYRRTSSKGNESAKRRTRGGLQLGSGKVGTSK